MVEAIRSNPTNEDVVAFTGFDFLGGSFRNNAATIFVTQKHWDERTVPVQRAGRRVLRQDRGTSRRAWCSPSTPPAIFGLGTAGGFEFYIQNRGDGGSKRLAEVSQPFLARGDAEPAARPGADPVARQRAAAATSTSTARRRKAWACRVDEVFNTLAATLGTYYVNDFNKYGRTWQVLMSAEPAFRKRPEDVGNIYVRSDKGEMMPVRRWRASSTPTGPDTLERFNNLPAVKIFGSGAPGVSSGPGDRGGRAHRARRCCRRTSRSTGAAPRSRRSARAAPRCSRSCWAR